MDFLKFTSAYVHFDAFPFVSILWRKTCFVVLTAWNTRSVLQCVVAGPKKAKEMFSFQLLVCRCTDANVSPVAKFFVPKEPRRQATRDKENCFCANFWMRNFVLFLSLFPSPTAIQNRANNDQTCHRTLAIRLADFIHYLQLYFRQLQYQIFRLHDFSLWLSSNYQFCVLHNKIVLPALMIRLDQFSRFCEYIFHQHH